MGEIVFAAKVTHVPTMYLSEQDGPLKGCRAGAIEGHRRMGELVRAAGADTFVVLDTHWLVNSGYHVNANSVFRGPFTSHEFPQFIQNLPYEYRGDVELGEAIAEKATAMGVPTRAHHLDSLGLHYGTLIPMRYQNADAALAVVSVAAWCIKAELDESRVFGEAVAEAIAESGSKVALLASGSLSHRLWPNRLAEAGMFKMSSKFNELVDGMVLEMWRAGRIAEFLEMLPEYAQHCSGEAGMHDTAMLFGALGWDRYTGRGEVLSDYFPSSGTGQVNVMFTLPESSASVTPASAAGG
ncbi:MAG TPA: 3,4-dihydroxyphenylacetate 2,3-dioxygenase [Gammaproteobacteria bacterium]